MVHTSENVFISTPLGYNKILDEIVECKNLVLNMKRFLSVLTVTMNGGNVHAKKHLNFRMERNFLLQTHCGLVKELCKNIK